MKANDGLDYSIFQYGTDFANNIYCLSDKATPEAETTTSTWTAEGTVEFMKHIIKNEKNKVKVAKKATHKKAACLLFAFLLCMNSFAAVVADNDGSAFITKAEFDSLKNDFQSQLDSYNTNIDSKIDAAIAGYLAGIKAEVTEELDSYLNKINALAEDFYLDGSGNKVKYGYRCMARRHNVKTTQKPVGAITNLMMIRLNNDLANADTFANNRTRSIAMARVSMNRAYRTAIGDVHVPKDDYQIDKYMMVKKRNDGSFYPYNKYDDITYRYYVGGQSFTYDVSVGFPPTTAADPGTVYNDNGTWTHDEMKNEDKFWGLKIATAKWVWEQQLTQEYTYDPMRTVYGGSFEYQENDEVFPMVSYTNVNIYVLDQDRLSEQALESVARNRNLRLDRGLYIYQIPDMSKMYGIWHAPASQPGSDDPDFEYQTDPDGGTVPWTFYFNHHPWQYMNTKDLVDNSISQVLGEPVKLTSGIPVCKVTMDGTLDIKMQFMGGDSSHTYNCGWQKKPFEPNNSQACQIDGTLHLRDFNNVTRGSTITIDDELDFRMDVKKGDVIWIRCVDASDQYGFVGAKTISIKNTKEQ